MAEAESGSQTPVGSAGSVKPSCSSPKNPLSERISEVSTRASSNSTSGNQDMLQCEQKVSKKSRKSNGASCATEFEDLKDSDDDDDDDESELEVEDASDSEVDPLSIAVPYPKGPKFTAMTKIRTTINDYVCKLETAQWYEEFKYPTVKGVLARWKPYRSDCKKHFNTAVATS